MAFNLDKNDGPAKSKFDLSKADASTPEFQEPKKGNKLIWIILGAIVVVAAIYFISQKSDSSTTEGPIADTTQQTTTPTEPTQSTDTSAGSSAQSDVPTTATPPAAFTPLTFPKASADVKEVDESKINEVLEYLKTNPAAIVNIEGYASSEGTLDFNMKLSESRANNFASFLRSKGVKAENLNITGKGIENPVASNDDENGRSQNRRVEIKF
jgi:outer membrane protein OmpA-like peptidoglycan-associated protein